MCTICGGFECESVEESLSCEEIKELSVDEDSLIISREAEEFFKDLKIWKPGMVKIGLVS